MNRAGQNPRGSGLVAQVAHVSSVRGLSALEAACAAAAGMADERGIPVPAGFDLHSSPDAVVRRMVAEAPPQAPVLVAQVYEACLGRSERRAGGVHYTPTELARGLFEAACSTLEPGRDLTEIRVLDPACGGGGFLLAAADLLVARGADPVRVVAHQLHGFDRDADAVTVSSAALSLWLADRGGAVPEPAELGVMVLDFLVDDPGEHHRFDIVIGNPPFQNQLETATARARAEHGALKARLGSALAPYVDNAALFLLVAGELVAPRGVLCLIQPTSFLSSRDASGVRESLLESYRLCGLWLAGEPVFSASVFVCAPMLRRLDDDGPAAVRRFRGAGVEEVASTSWPVEDISGASWSPLGADLLGVPQLAFPEEGRLADLASATAGFRDQFYGFIPHVCEESDLGAGEPSARLITSGMIDPGMLRWGERRFRYAKRSWLAPRVRLTSLEADPALARWTKDRLVSKVLLATQTRVVEAAVDLDGDCVPVTPVISVEPAEDDLWLVVAVLLAPPVSAWAMRQYAGAALTNQAIKLSASQVLDIPTPGDRGRWEKAASLLASGNGGLDRDEWLRFGSMMSDAYGISDQREVIGWWSGRWPQRCR